MDWVSLPQSWLLFIRVQGSEVQRNGLLELLLLQSLLWSLCLPVERKVMANKREKLKRSLTFSMLELYNTCSKLLKVIDIPFSKAVGHNLSFLHCITQVLYAGKLNSSLPEASEACSCNCKTQMYECKKHVL